MPETPPTVEAAWDLYRLLSGDEPDCYWKALLTVATASPVMWKVFQPFLDLERQEIHREGLEAQLGVLSEGEGLMLELALHLFDGGGSVDVAHMAMRLDRGHWRKVLEALRVFRAGFAGIEGA